MRASAAKDPRVFVAAALALAAGARAQEVQPRAEERSAQSEAQAAQAWLALANRKNAEPAQAVASLVHALAAADLGATASLSLARLGDPSKTTDAAVRTAARAELLTRAEGGDALALGALLELRLEPEEVAQHPALAVNVARAHLEAALLAQPLPEGGSFDTGVPKEGQPGVPQKAAAKDAPPGVVEAKGDLAEVRRLTAAVPAASSHSREAREVAGLASLAAGDELSAEKEFSSIAGAEGRGQRALLQLARLAYARGDDQRAEALYARVGRGAPEWLDALFEASWTHFRRGEDERVLGNLLTLHAPFFNGREFPEGYVLQALVLYENCRYVDARRALARLETVFRPRHDGLAAALAAVEALPQPFEALGEKRAQLAAALQPPARAELERAASAPDLQVLRAAVLRLNAELDSFDHRAGLRGSAFARAVLPDVREARLRLMVAAGERLKSRLGADRAELRELLGQSLRLSYEISGRERDQAKEKGARATARPGEQAEVTDDEVLWPFQGEYWRDELGSYRFQLGTRCEPAPRFQRPPPSAALEKAR
jgi:hypothetical protein